MAYTNNLHVVYGEASLGVNGQDFAYLFSYERGGLESLKIKDKEWLYRTPTPTFWRATTDNDRGSGFNQKAAQWLGADMFTKCVGIHVKLTITNSTNCLSLQSIINLAIRNSPMK